jgi:hypothetical protein
MDHMGTVIASGAERMMGLAEALLGGVEASRFARFASPGGETVHANHPAFIYGHLSLYPARVLIAAGEEASGIAAPAGWEDLFQHGAECRDDPEGSIYPAMDEIVRVFTDGHRAAIEKIRGWSDARMAERHGIEGRMAEAFPTVGHVSNFLMLGHTMMHLGQMSTWRRAEGLGSAM